MIDDHPTYEELKEEIQQLKTQLALSRKEQSVEDEKKENSWVTLNSIGDAVMTIDINGLITFMNPVSEELTGWSEKKAVNKKLTEVLRIINAETRDIVQNPVGKVFESGNIEWLAKNTLLISNDGTECQIGDSASPIRDNEENITGVVLVFRDVSEYHLLYRELQKKNETLENQKHELEIFKRMLEGSNDMMVAIDKDYRYIYANSAFLNYPRLKNEEFLGHKVKEVLGDESFKDLKTHIDKAFKGETVGSEVTAQSPEYGEIYLETTYYPLKNDDGGINKVVGVLRDITDRKQTKELLKTRNKFYNLVEQISEVLILLDKKGQIMELNLAAEKVTGFSRKELYKMNVTELLPQITKKTMKEKWESISVHEPAVTEEKDYKTKNGDIYPAELRISKVTLENEYYFLVILHDITENKQAKEQLIEAKEQAEESDRLKSAFLANLTHEIHTPMNGIMGFSQILKEQEVKEEEQQKYIDIIYSRSNQLLQIINDIVDASKIEANSLQLQFQNAYVNEIIDELYEIYLNELKSQEKAHITLKANKGLDHNSSFIHIDPYRFRQIMDNLLNNAIKFTPEGTIAFGYELQSKNTMLFYVEDTGIAISPDQQQYIFDGFRQADEAIGRKYEGTGLGLTISRKLVDLMGGTMWVDSKKEEGAVFYFTLPYKTEPVKENKDKKINKETGQRQYEDDSKTVLIIEDDSTSLEYMKILLKPNGFDTILCETGKEGYKKFREHPDIDLVLLDLKLPDISGLDVLRKIRSSSSNNEVPVIAQTAYNMSGDAQKSKDAGCNDYISKSFEKEKLLKIIRKYI